MYYAQQHYPQQLGNGQLTIAEAGCLLTATANLLVKLNGSGPDPVTLNEYYKQRGLYIHDADGADEDLAWTSVHQYDASIELQQSGGGAVPPSNIAIVKFHYNSVHTGQPIDHFCLVDHVENGQVFIIDSWDGMYKGPAQYVGVYHSPVAWATYVKAAPAPVSSGPPYAVEDIDPKQVITNKQPTTMWGMNYDNLQAMVAHPIKTVEKGKILTVSQKIHHNVGYTYYREAGEVDAWNEKDCDDYVAPAPYTGPAGAAMVPIALQKYSLVTTVMAFPSATDAANHTKGQSTLSPGNYVIFKTAMNGMLNLTKDITSAGVWVNPADNVPPAPKPQPEPVPVTVAPAPAPKPKDRLPDDVKAGIKYFNADGSPVKFVLAYPYNFVDLNGYSSKPVKRGLGDEVEFVGTFAYRGAEWARVYVPEPNGMHQNKNLWFAIPMLNPATYTPYITPYDVVYNYAKTPVEQIIMSPAAPYTKAIKFGVTVDALYDKVVKSIDGVFRKQKVNK